MQTINTMDVTNRPRNEPLACDEVGEMRDRLAETGSPLYSKSHRQMYDFPSLHWCTNQRVLEIGVGYGYGTAALAMVAREVVGIDTSQKSIAFAEKNFRFPNTTYHVADICTWDAPDESFDVAVMIEVVEHLENPVAALRNLHRLLRPAGIVFVSTPWPLLTETGTPANPHHVQEFYPREFMTLMGQVFTQTILFGRSGTNMLALAQKAWQGANPPDPAAVDWDANILPFDDTQARAGLASLIAGRPVAILAHGKSLQDFRQHSKELADLGFCYASLNAFAPIETEILEPIGKRLSIVLCTSEEEFPKRAFDIRSFLERPEENYLITTREAVAGAWFLEERFRHKVVFVPKPQLPTALMPNSLTLLIEALVRTRSASSLVLFGADGSLERHVHPATTYYHGQLLQNENRSWNLVNDTQLFNLRIGPALRRLYRELGIEPVEILNCSPSSVLTPFPRVSHQYVLARFSSRVDAAVAAGVVPHQLAAVGADARAVGCDGSDGVREYKDYFLCELNGRVHAVSKALGLSTLVSAGSEELQAHIQNAGIIVGDSREEVAGLIDLLGQRQVIEAPATPDLVGETAAYNLVRAGSRTVALAKSLGPVALGEEKLGDRDLPPHILTGSTSDDLRARVAEYETQATSPQLVEDTAAYNIVRVGARYVGVAKTLGPISLDIEKIGERELAPHVLVSTTLEELRTKIINYERIVSTVN